MKCVICARETKLGEAYVLPFLTRVQQLYKNLYACSRACRQEWTDARRQVQAIQMQITDPERRDSEGERTFRFATQNTEINRLIPHRPRRIKMRRCSECANYFDGRANAQTCSNKCRMARSRRLQELA